MAQSNGSIQKGRLQAIAITAGILLIALLSTLFMSFLAAWVGGIWFLPLLWMVPVGILCYLLNAGVDWARWLVIGLLGLWGLFLGSTGLWHLTDGIGLMMVGIAAICLTSSWLLLRSVHLKTYLAYRKAQRFPAGR